MVRTRGTFNFRRRRSGPTAILLILAVLITGRIIAWLSGLLTNLYLQTISWVPGNQVSNTYYRAVDFGLIGLALFIALGLVLILLALSLTRRRR